MKLSILYSQTSHGQIQTWQIEIKDECFRTHEGILDGVITISEWTECFGKNTRKANETSAPEQADKEAAAKHKKKLESGYYEDVKEIAKSKFFEPMLAKQFEDYKDEIKFPVYSQPKLDGTRCPATISGLNSRNGKPIVSVPHVFDDVKRHLDVYSEEVWDGELYCEKLKNDFNKIISLVKKTKPTAADLEESEKYIEYWVYDIKTPANLPFGERTELLRGLIESHHKLYPESYIRYVPTTLCENMDELDELYFKYLEQGFEGQMIRTVDGLYENKRSKNLLKRKTMQDSEFLLVDLEEGRGNRAGMATRAILKTATGEEFETGMIGSHEYCINLLKNKKEIIGKMVTVVYQNLTPDKGVPRFGKMKAVRWDV